MDKGFLTASEVSQYLNIKLSTIYAWVRSREIPYYRVHKTIRFKKDDIDLWMEGHKEKMINLEAMVKKVLHREVKA